MKKSKVKALGLSSGGLDSILSALVLRDQGIDVTWISFETPFFDAENAKKASEATGIPIIVEDITEEYLLMLHNPKAGYGKNMNPCMDCHTLMFRKAGEYIMRGEFDFLFSGEVSGQRPFSQRKMALRYVEKNSGFDGKILRPLSAKNLPVTKVEEDGLVDREKLLDIFGRGRKDQIALAEHYGIKEYPNPAGGCLLTDKGFSDRLRELFEYKKDYTKNDLHLLKHGRHFRIKGTKVIVGRTKSDNQSIEAYFSDSDAKLRLDKIPGPIVLICGQVSEDILITAGEICAAYAKVKGLDSAPVVVKFKDGERRFDVELKAVSDFSGYLI